MVSTDSISSFKSLFIIVDGRSEASWRQTGSEGATEGSHCGERSGTSPREVDCFDSVIVFSNEVV